MLSSVRFLARQGLPLRGDMDETDSHFYQLLMLWGEDGGPGITAFLDKKQLKYTSHDMQNEMLSNMGLRVLCQVARNLQESLFCIMVNETTDVGNDEQVALVFDGSTMTWL